MSDFDEGDVTIEHTRHADRSGSLRLIHRPSGLSVEADLTSQPVLRAKQELMDRLRQRVLARLAERDSSEAAAPEVPAAGRA